MMGSRQELIAILNKLKPLVKEAVGEQADFENIWANVTAEFLTWVQKYGGSFLDVKISLIQMLVRAFDNDSLRTNKAIINIVVAGTIMGGNEFRMRNWRGAWVSYPVVDRYITYHGGVMLVLKNKIGCLFKREFID